MLSHSNSRAMNYHRSADWAIVYRVAASILLRSDPCTTEYEVEKNYNLSRFLLHQQATQ